MQKLNLTPLQLHAMININGGEPIFTDECGRECLIKGKDVITMMSSTYKPLPGDRVYTMDDQPGTICGQDEVYGTVKEIIPNKALVHWDDNKLTWEILTDEVIFPEDIKHSDPNWRPIKLEAIFKPITKIR